MLVGATAFVACDVRTEVFHPAAVRGSVGNAVPRPDRRMRSEDALAWLRVRGITVVVATPDNERAVWETDLRRPLALVVGSERHGVSVLWRDEADETVSIPMPARRTASTSRSPRASSSSRRCGSA